MNPGHANFGVYPDASRKSPTGDKARVEPGDGCDSVSPLRARKEQKIISRRRGLHKRFYTTQVFGDRELEILDTLSQETDRDILLFLIQNPNATQKELSEYVRISPASINWHMGRLSDTGLVEAKRDRMNVRYLVRNNRAEILALLKSYHPAIWERWADRLANIISHMERETHE